MTAKLLTSLFRYKAWANQGLIDALETIPEDADRRQRAVIVLTLDHTSLVDRIFKARILGETPPFEITVPLDDIDWDADDPLPQIVERFHDRHEGLYTYALRDQGAVLVNARAAVIGVLPGVPQEPTLTNRDAAAARGERRIWLRDWVTVPVFDTAPLAEYSALAD